MKRYPIIFLIILLLFTGCAKETAEETVIEEPSGTLKGVSLSPRSSSAEDFTGFFEEADFITIVVGEPMLWWRVCPEKHRGKALVVDINYGAQEAGTSAASAAGFIGVVPFPITVEDATTTIEGALETLAAQS